MKYKSKLATIVTETPGVGTGTAITGIISTVKKDSIGGLRFETANECEHYCISDAGKFNKATTEVYIDKSDGTTDMENGIMDARCISSTHIYIYGSKPWTGDLSPVNFLNLTFKIKL